MDLLEEVFHSPGMKALFFHIGELVNTVHATAVPTKGSSATGGYTGWHSLSRTGQKSITLQNTPLQDCLNQLCHFKTLHREVSSFR